MIFEGDPIRLKDVKEIPPSFRGQSVTIGEIEKLPNGDEVYHVAIGYQLLSVHKKDVQQLLH